MRVAGVIAASHPSIPSATSTYVCVIPNLGRIFVRIVCVDPKIARMLLAGRDFHCLREILTIAAGLSIQDPRERPYEAREAVDRAQAKFQDERSDFLAYLKLWDFFEDALKHKQSNRKLIQQCHDHYLSYLRLREWRAGRG